MNVLRSWSLAAPIAALVIACSGSDATVGGGGDAAADGSGGMDGATDSGGNGDGSMGGDGAAGDASTMDAGTMDASNMDASTMDAGACPDEHGKYTVVATGLGCGDLSATAPQCITQQMCAIALSSSGTGGAKALNGSADLAGDGSFMGAAIKEGTVNRTGCTGSWDANTSTLTVDCGGVGTTQSCRAVLTRTALNCN